MKAAYGAARHHARARHGHTSPALSVCFFLLAFYGRENSQKKKTKKPKKKKKRQKKDCDRAGRERLFQTSLRLLVSITSTRDVRVVMRSGERASRPSAKKVNGEPERRNASGNEGRVALKN